MSIAAFDEPEPPSLNSSDCPKPFEDGQGGRLLLGAFALIMLYALT